MKASHALTPVVALLFALVLTASVAASGNEVGTDVEQVSAQAPNAPVTCVSTDVPQPIPDLGSAVSTLTIYAGPPVSGLQVTGVTLEHTYPGDTIAYLTGPDGTQVTLWDYVCGSSSWTSANTGFNLLDGAPDAFGDVCPPGTGDYYPLDSLSAFDGLSPIGTWTLTIADVAGGDFGRLYNWGLRAEDLQCIDFTPGVDLSIVKRDTPDPVFAGDELAYDLEVHNGGTDLAASTVVTDALPAGLTFEDAYSTAGTCSFDGGVVTCALGDVASGAYESVTIEATVDEAFICPGTIVNDAWVSSAVTDADPADNHDSESTRVPCIPQEIVTCLSTDVPKPIEDYDYTYSALIIDGGLALDDLQVVGLTLDHTYPSDLDAYLEGPDGTGITLWSDECDDDPWTAANTGFNLLDGAADPFGSTCPPGTGDYYPLDALSAFDGLLPAGTWTLAIEDYYEGDAGTLHNWGLRAFGLVCHEPESADLSIVKTGAPAVVQPDGVLTYTLAVHNAGPDSAAVIVTDALPAQYVFDSVTLTGTAGACIYAGGEVVCSIGDLDSGAGATIEILGYVDPDAPCPWRLANVASVDGTAADPDTGNNESTVYTPVTCEPPPVVDVAPDALALTVPQGFPGSVTQPLTITNVGDDLLTWELVEQAGAGLAPDALLWDNGPLVTHPGGGYGGADASRLQDMTLGMYSMAFSASEYQGTRVADDFVVSASDGWIIDTATFFFIIAQGGESTHPAAPEAIDFLSVRIWDGPPDDPASSIVFGDEMTNLLVSVVPANIYRDTEYEPGIPYYPIMVVEATIGAWLAPGTYWIDWRADDPYTWDVGVPPVTILGQTTTGNGMAYDWSGTWVDALDSGTNTPQGLPFILDGTVVDIPSCTPVDIPWLSGSPISGTVPGGLSEVVDATYANMSGLATGIYTGTLCVENNDPVNPSVSVPVTLTVRAPAADVAIVKTAPGTVVAGDPLAYTLAVDNSGPDPAASVVVTDALPAGFVYGGYTATAGTCSVAAGLLTCTLGDVANGASATITVTGTVDAAIACPGELGNTAYVSSPTDPNLANNQSTATTQVACQPADLSIVKFAPAGVTAGDPLAYTLVVTNTGPGPAFTVVVTDALPAGFVYGGHSASVGTCSVAAGLLTCTLGDMANGASATITVTGTVDAAIACPGALSNTAYVTGQTDPNAANNQSTATTQVACRPADLSIVKTALPGVVRHGDTLTYTLVVANAGPGVGMGTVVTDPLPLGFAFGGVSTTAGTCSFAGGAVDCALGDLADGASATVVISGTIDTPQCPGNIDNAAYVSSLVGDTDPSDNASSAGVAVACHVPVFNVAPSILTLTVPQGYYVPATQTLTISNTGLGDLIWSLDEAIDGCGPADIPWLSAAPLSGTLAGAGQLPIAVTYDDMSALATGTYTGTLCFNTNDPVHPQVPVPVTLIVREPTDVRATALSAASAPHASPLVLLLPALAALVALIARRRR